MELLKELIVTENFAETNIVQRIIEKLKGVLRYKRPFRYSIISKKDEHDLVIDNTDAVIEVRDGFNDKLILQHYHHTASEKKIVLYIPREWKSRITIHLKRGTVFLLQKEVYQHLEISIKNGVVKNEKDQ